MMDSLATVACPLCGHDRRLRLKVSTQDDCIASYGALYAGRTRSEWAVCDRCGFVHQNPRPSAAALDRFYSDGKYHPPLEQYDLATLTRTFRHAYRENTRFVLRQIGSTPGKVFDVGCGFGFALLDFARVGWECYGVEPDPARAEFARRELGLVHVQRGLCDAQVDLGTSVDVVISHHTFEHIADLDAAMRGVSKVLKPNGVFFARVPTYLCNRSRMSLRYMNSGHYSMFTHRSMAQLVVRYGLEPIRHQYVNKAGMGVTDDLFFLARKTGREISPETYFESPREVQRYVTMINPLRSALFSPVYSLRYRALMQRLSLLNDIAQNIGLVSSPRTLAAKLRARVRRPAA